MKIAKIKHSIQDGKLVFEVQEVQDIPFGEVPGIDKILKEMNLQRYYIRRRKNSGKKLYFD